MGDARSRATWSVVDQVISSGANFLLLLLIIMTSDTAQVGAFGLAYTAFFLVLCVVRGVTLEPLIVRFTSAPRDGWAQAARAATGLTLSLAILIGAPATLVSLAVGGFAGRTFAAVAAMLPGLLMQDAWRLAFFSLGRPGRACWNDALYLAVQLFGFALLAEMGAVSEVSLILAWGIAALVAGVFGVVQSGIVPRPSQSIRWLRAHRDIGPAFSADYVASRGTEQLALVVLGVLGGLGSLGAVTAARTLFAPLTTLQSGVNVFALPELARLYLAAKIAEVRRLSLVLGVGVALVMIAGGLCLLALPDGVGESVFRSNWASARAVLVPMTVFSAVNALGYGLWVGLRGMQMAKPTLYARLASGMVTITAVAAGTMLAGATGATWGFACGASVTAALLMWLLFRGFDTIERSGWEPVRAMRGS